MTPFLEIEALGTLQNIGESVPSFANVSNYSSKPTIQELNAIWSGRGSTSTEDQFDTAIARERLEEIALGVATVVRGDALADRLKIL